jgi:hypothetical protein
LHQEMEFDVLMIDDEPKPVATSLEDFDQGVEQ